MSELRDISTAPKDGRWIVVNNPYAGDDEPPWNVTRWIVEKVSVWEQVDNKTKKLVEYDESHWDGYVAPTHWMPLPEPPTP